MSLKQIHKTLTEIKSTSSSNSKIELLSSSLQNSEFRLVITLMYDDFLHFKVNKLPPFVSQDGAFAEKSTTTEIFSFLNKLSNQKGASNSDKMELARLASIDAETYEVVKRIVNKNAKCGFAGKTINKAYNDLLFLMPYCRCSTEKNKMHNIDYVQGAIGQEKADGMFSNIIISNTCDSLIRSRNGNIVHQMEHLHEFFKSFPKKYWDTVYMGELLIMIGGAILPRQTGNGILNSCLQNAAEQGKAGHAIVKLWDAVPQKDFWAGKCDIAYKYRLGRASMLTKEMNNKNLSLIQSKMLHSLDDAQTFYKKLRLDGKEGAIVKNIHAKWKDHTSPDQVKMKNVSDIELRIVGWKYGKKDTKFWDCMGSVQLESDDGLIKVSVSGFKDKERVLNWDEREGKVATLEYDGLIKDKSRPGIHSLYLPRNLEMRPDRSYTDTLKDAKSR